MPEDSTGLAVGGGELVIRQLEQLGVHRVFMVAGESFLPCIDALRDRDTIETISFRQEGGAAYAAEAHAKLTGEPGICFVTRGPGATNASIGLHVAMQDGTPMILFVGQIGSDTVERRSFQEIDYRRMFGQVAKWVGSIDRTDRIPELVARAWRVACSGRPGPVVLVLPEDTLWGQAQVPTIAAAPLPQPGPSDDDMQVILDALAVAQRPFVLAGGHGWDDASRKSLQDFAERFDLPVGVSWRRFEAFDNRHPNFAGHVGFGMQRNLARRIADADLVIAVNTRIDEPTSEGYTLFESPVPRQRLIHIHADAAELGTVYRADHAIVATPTGFARKLAGLAPEGGVTWAGSAAAANSDYQLSLTPPAADVSLDLSVVSASLSTVLPQDAVVTLGAGNFALYPHRFLQFTGRGTQASPICGSMGYGLPAAIAAKLEWPDRRVVCFAGDGCFQMTLQEMATASQHRLGLVIIVCNNSAWGTIRAHQERDYPGRSFGLNLENPDFSRLAQAYGGYGEVVEATADFLPAWYRATAFADANRRPALIELRYDVDAIAPDSTLTEIRKAAEEAGR